NATPPAVCRVPGAALTQPRHAHVARAARRFDRDDVADLRPDQRAADRRLRAELAHFEVLLGGADKRERLLAARALVDERHGRAEGHGVAARRRLDDARAAQAGEQPPDARLEVRLVLLARVVLGVLGEVAVLARAQDPLGEALALLGLP